MAERILIVDDDAAIREFVEMALIDEGYEVLIAEDGLQALNIVKRLPVDLIVLDMRMPVMDGFAFLNAYEQVEMQRAPVIAISANQRAIAGTTVDVVDFIPKPFNLDDLLSRIDEQLS